MKFILHLIALALVLPFAQAESFAANPPLPSGLKCEYLKNPLGIDNPNPRFTWLLTDTRKGATQTAYQVLVDTDSAKVALGTGTEWDTKKVVSGNTLAVYKGKALRPFTKYYWAVTLWDKDGQKTTQAVASFEMGMINQQNWRGAWISDTRDVNLKPAPYFRKTFATDKKIKSARVYVAVAGLYELYINGQKIGNHRLDPMYTRFDRRTLYVTHDVTAALQNSKNAIGVLLGNGWYNHQSTAVWNFHEAPWRGRPTFCLDLRITYDDGTTEVISSGKGWKTAPSPVIFNSIYTAEHQDARLAQDGWNNPDFNDKDWKDVIFRTSPSQNIVAQAMVPVRNVEEIPAKSMKKLNDTTYLFDLGRNISGVSQLKIKGEAGTVVRLKHAERLGANGFADMSNIDIHYRPTDNQDPFQVDVYTLSGKGEDTFMPHFNYKGFQYVELTCAKPLQLSKGSLTGYFMHSDVPPAGQVTTANPTMNKLWWATNNSYLSNLFGYPTDCPQREKNGWTGDAHIASETGLYNFDAITVYEKWLADHRDEQQANGVLPSIIPTGGWGYEWGNGPDWTSTIAIIPWNIYLFYGDTKILADNYSHMKRYVDYIQTIAPKHLTTWGLGDWVPVKSKSPVEFTSSVYYFVDATIVAKTAALLGKTADAAYYSSLAKNIKDAINAKYLNRENGIYGSGVQTELSVPLQWGIVPEDMKAKVAANLAKRVQADGSHIDVGLLGTKAILNALSENGYADLAYAVAAQETYPSWGWWIKNGATTLYENWPIDAKSDISLNHIMFGEIGAWLYKALGGIKPDETKPGFKNVLIEPHFVKDLTGFAASHDGPQGRITSAWKKTDKGIEYRLVIPANSTATLKLHLPDGKQLYENGKIVKAIMKAQTITLANVVAGEYLFEIR
ncbi:alpha-L-rhamnosidase [Emticicia sp. 21SJ11W-3]|uniref:alpha-L-rhamnosidase n=1 Tax=Emticicia sp. 21SJ11W-3 TaxID=2916755 RepID=UPI0020A00813|nr:alpha-L-rhamnosidase [Emticicia sp. 21SJ11W-3]UTA66339.1 glycoside hydrolase family 78 protein [Emticicia sp. 21SJ11W-3]